jgi:type IV secretion system protein VirB6
LFEGWLRTALLFAIAPTLTVLVGSAALAFLRPLIDAIADNPAAAVSDLQPILELFLGSVIFFALIAMLMWTSASLVRGWRFGTAAEEGGVGGSASSSVTVGVPDVPIGRGSSASAPPADPRVGQVVSSLARSEAGSAPVSVRVEQASAVPRSDLPAGVGVGGVAAAHRRTEGLGQGFRAPARPARLSGAPS